MSDAVKIIVGILFGAVLMLLLIAGFFGGGMGMMMRGGMMGGGMIGALFMSFFWILVIALTVGLVFLIIRASR